MLNLSQAAAALTSPLLGADAAFTSVSTDTRTLEPGALFIALRGERVDGHDYLELALEKGAAGALVDRAANLTTSPLSSRLPLIYVKGTDDALRHPKMRALIDDAASSLIRRRFNSSEELIAAVYASLVRILEERELIRFGPFDATFCRNATLDDLDEERITRFLGLARRGRSFPLPENTKPYDVLVHLNLLDKERPTNAAILLFGKKPQRFLITSEVKCAHFHGYEVAKPIPSYQVYKGTVFDLVDQAKDFVLSKIDLWVGTRAESTQVPTKYEIPQEVVAEAIVNAVVHRDYTSNASVQVMLFRDRLEVWNPGTLPPTLTLEKLRGPHPSLPHNPLIAEPMYLTKYIERMGTGIRDMIRRCRKAGLQEPEIRIDGGSWVLTIRRKDVKGNVTEQVEAQVENHVLLTAVEIDLINACKAIPRSAQELLNVAGYKTRTGNFKRSMEKLLNEDLLAMTIQDKPNSRNQRYNATDKGRELLQSLNLKV